MKTPPKKLPISDIAVLGLVVSRMYMGFKGGITGKQLLEEMNKSSFPDWVDIKYSTLYNCLSRLKEYDYLKSVDKIDNDSRKRIKLYIITNSGKLALFNEIIFLLSNPIKEKSPLDLAIGNIGLLPLETSITALNSYLKRLNENIGFLEMYVTGLKNGKKGDVVGNIILSDLMLPVINNLLALFERPYRELVARKEWLIEFIQKLEDGKIFTIK